MTNGFVVLMGFLLFPVEPQTRPPDPTPLLQPHYELGAAAPNGYSAESIFLQSGHNLLGNLRRYINEIASPTCRWTAHKNWCSASACRSPTLRRRTSCGRATFRTLTRRILSNRRQPNPIWMASL